MKVEKHLLIYGILLLGFLLSSCDKGSVVSDHPVETAILASSKSEAEDWATLLKTKKIQGKVTDTDYASAVELYIKAKGAYAGYLAAVQNLVKTNNQQNLQEMAKNAAQEKENFINKTSLIVRDSGTRGLLPIADLIEGLVNGGISIWKATKDLDQSSRDEFTKSLEKYNWAKIQSIQPLLPGEGPPQK